MSRAGIEEFIQSECTLISFYGMKLTTILLARKYRNLSHKRGSRLLICRNITLTTVDIHGNESTLSSKFRIRSSGVTEALYSTRYLKICRR
jgi:hypothetical protein